MYHLLSDRIRWLSGVAALLLAACAGASAQTTPTPARATLDVGEIRLVAPEALPTSTLTDPRLRRGGDLYQIHCAHCHGYQGEGQNLLAPGETMRLGMKPVPPHDATGDTWRYADPVLFAAIKYGIDNPLNQYPMIAYDLVLSDEEIFLLLDYIRLWWTDEQRAHQAEVTENLVRAREQSGLQVYPLDEDE
jgi:mono/diheme cytochrome c family protein